jgi:WD40 repeat protein
MISQGHPDIINAAAWSPNGRLIATACDDMQLRVFDVGQLASQNIKFKWVKTPQAALGVGFGNDGSSLVAALRGEQCWRRGGGAVM